MADWLPDVSGPIPVSGSSGTAGFWIDSSTLRNAIADEVGVNRGSNRLRRDDDAADEATEEDRTELLVRELLLLLAILDDRTLLLDSDDADEAPESSDEETGEVIDDADERMEATDETALLLTAATAVHVVIVAVSVVTVPPYAIAMPFHDVLAPTVIPALSMIVPANTVFAARVVACTGVQKTLQAAAPFRLTVAPAVDVNAPLVRKINVPFPLKTSGPPIVIAPALQ